MHVINAMGLRLGIIEKLKKLNVFIQERSTMMLLKSLKVYSKVSRGIVKGQRDSINS